MLPDTVEPVMVSAEAIRYSPPPAAKPTAVLPLTVECSRVTAAPKASTPPPVLPELLPAIALLRTASDPPATDTAPPLVPATLPVTTTEASVRLVPELLTAPPGAEA